MSRAAGPASPADALNLGFELSDLPGGWSSAAAVQLDEAEHHSGRSSLRLQAAAGERTVSRAQSAARPFAGKRVRLSGWLKTRDVAGGVAAISLEVENTSRELLARERAAAPRVEGTSEWQQVALELDIPGDAALVVLGAALDGRGEAWFDDLQPEIIAPLPATRAFRGRVVDRDGAAVSGAWVAAISSRTGRSATLRSDSEGRFEPQLEPGVWEWNAAQGADSATLPAAESTDAELVLTLGRSADARVFDGRVLGEALASNSALVLGPLFGHRALIALDADGTFRVALPPAEKYFACLVDDPEVEIDVVREGAHLTLHAKRSGAAPEAVARFVAERAIPLASVEPGGDFADLRRLDALIGDARVVGLGEANHGTREFFQFKHRLIEYLISQHGFGAVAFEANFHDSRAIDDYVHTGNGDIRVAVERMAPIWQTEEVLALIEWMRGWNADPRHTRKISFHGFDLQETPRTLASIRRYLERVAPQQADDWLAPFELLTRYRFFREYPRESVEGRRALRASLLVLSKRFAASAANWTRQTSAQDYATARRELETLVQAEAHLSTLTPDAQQDENASFVVRDRDMAANAIWLLDQQPPGTRVIVWAHNGHVARMTSPVHSMGGHLAQHYGTKYLSLGFVPGHGTLQAADPVRRAGLHEFALPAPPHHDISHLFAPAGTLSVTDLRRAPPAVEAWLREVHPGREMGFVYSPRVGEMVLSPLYDAVIYIDQTTRARPLHLAP